MGNGASVGLSQLIGSDHDVTELPPKTQTERSRTGVVGPVVPASGINGVPLAAPTASSGPAVLNELKRQVRQRDIVLERFATEIDDLRMLVAARDAEVVHLKAEINKFKSVLDAKVPAGGSGGANGTVSGGIGARVKSDLLAKINEDAVMIGQETRLKKQGVSGESAQTGHGVHELKRFDKDFKLVKFELTFHLAKRH